jgi:regulator of RNase E activity RraA
MRNLLILLTPLAALSQTPDPAQKAYIQLKTYTQAEDDRILKVYDGLRVADVADGLDMAGLQGVGLMDPAIRPLWRDTENFEHRFIGIAVTARYVPTNRRADRMTPEDFRKWESNWYTNISSEPFSALLRPGAALVIDGGEDGDTGSIGSNNILAWKLRGMRGVVTSGGIRDTDEVIKEKVPAYHKRFGRGIRPGRNEVESVNRAIMCGGTLVRPGDVIVADGDGVVVVPREHAEEVAKAARQILDSDKKGRRGLYQKLGIPEDKTVR